VCLGGTRAEEEMLSVGKGERFPPPTTRGLVALVGKRRGASPSAFVQQTAICWGSQLTFQSTGSAGFKFVSHVEANNAIPSWIFYF
jgi:hypothetical protein